MKYFYRHNKKILHHRFIIKISRMQSKKTKTKKTFFGHFKKKLSNRCGSTCVRAYGTLRPCNILKKFLGFCTISDRILSSNTPRFVVLFRRRDVIFVLTQGTSMFVVLLIKWKRCYLRVIFGQTHSVVLFHRRGIILNTFLFLMLQERSVIIP